MRPSPHPSPADSVEFLAACAGREVSRALARFAALRAGGP